MAGGWESTLIFSSLGAGTVDKRCYCPPFDLKNWMKEISSSTVLVTILTFANYSRAGRNRWEWAFWDRAFGAGTLVQGAQGSQEAPLARLLLQSETSFPYWSPASLRPLSHRSARPVSSPLIGWDPTSLTEPANHGPGHRLGDFIISHLGSYSIRKSKLEAEVWSDIDS